MGQENGRDDEIAALMQAEGVDSAKIAEQVARKGGKVVEPKKEEEPKGGEPSKKEEPAKTEPPKGEEPKKDVPSPETIRTAMLNEMFGEQFKTVEDVKKANIPASLQELATLRQENQTLKTQLQAKPKHQFANDDIAKFNEFVRETGIKDARIFDRLNSEDVAKMDDINVLILNHIVDNPRYANRDPQELRAYFETKYDVVDLEKERKRLADEEITQEEFDKIKRQMSNSKIDMESDADKARTKLSDLKGKIKMPETPKEELEAGKETKWTPEIEAKQKAEWTKANEAMYEVLKKQPIRVKGFKEPIGYFEVPDEAKGKVLANAIDYVISNQLEAGKEEYLKYIAQAINTELKDIYEEERNQVAFERGRSISQKELLELYHNPSKRNDDTPAGGGEDLSDEAKLKKAYDAELAR